MSVKNYQINYICEVNYPSTSAYGLHVIKMCDSLYEPNIQINLIAPNISCDFSKLKNIYNIKNKFKTISIFKTKIKINLISRIFFSIKILSSFKCKNNVFISRSVIFSFIAAILKKKNILELHHELTGFTKFFYHFICFFKLDKYLQYIFIHKNLIKNFNSTKNVSLCLDDAVDLNDYLIKKKNKRFKNTCVYIGSFYPGKGIEIISILSKQLPNFNFHLYGDKNYLPNIPFEKNIKFFGYLDYKKIPQILSKYDVALMPYLNVVRGRHKNLNLVNNMSPLKMFDYLASGKIILATNLKVYRHILKNKYNSILINDGEIDQWVLWIKKIFKNLRKFNYIKKNSLVSVKKYTWLNRGKKIKRFIKKQYF